MSARQLVARVHVRDDQGWPSTFGPGDEVPDWAAEQITNPAAWADGSRPDEVSGSEKPREDDSVKSEEPPRRQAKAPKD